MRKILVGLLLLVALPGFATDYYLDCDAGLDSNDGLSSGAPWLTIAKVESNGLVAGDTLFINRGTTCRDQFDIPGAGSVGNVITIDAYGTGDLPKIYGSTEATGFIDQGGNQWDASITNDPVEVYFLETDGSITWGTEDATLDAEYDWTWSLGTLSVWSATDPDTAYTAVEAADKTEGVILQDTDDFITIKNIEVAFADQRCIRVRRVSNIIIDGVTAHHCGEDLSETGDALIIQVDGAGITDSTITVQNSTFHNGGRHGIAVNTGNATATLSGVTIVNNTVYDSFHNHVDIQALSGTLGTVTIERNTIYSTAQVAAKDHSCIILQANTTHTLDNTIVRNNLCVNPTSYGIHASARVATFDLFNNTVYMPIAAASGAVYGIKSDSTNSAGDIRNNVVWTQDVDAIQIEDSADVTTMDYNTWYTVTGDHVEVDATGYATVAALQAATTYADNSSFADPTFTNATTDPATWDFSLASGSPAINTGVDLSAEGYTNDRAGTARPQGSAWDMGAYELAVAVKADTPSPANAATDVAITATTSWADGGGADTYDVYFGTNADPDAEAAKSSGQAGTTYDPGTLANGTVYYWQIDSINGAATTEGDIWSFTTIAAVGGGGGDGSPTPTVDPNAQAHPAALHVAQTIFQMGLWVWLAPFLLLPCWRSFGL